MIVALLFVAAGCWLAPWLAGAAAVRFARRRVINYRGVAVPLGLGWAWLTWALALMAAAVLAGNAAPQLVSGAVLVGGTAVLGWLDDAFGTSEQRGLRGHLAALGRGRVTTGALKLVGIGALSLWAAWPLQPAAAALPMRVAGWLVGAVVIAGAANLLNLLDLRPGRALKAYVVVAVPCAVLEVAGAGWSAALAWLAVAVVLAVLGPAVACWRADLGERAMLGDMGANAAGALAGWMLVSVLPLPGLVVAAIVLVALNLASERVSFSAVIGRNWVLRALDGLGRVRRVTPEEEDARGETGT